MNAMPRGFSWFFSGTDKGGAAPCEKEAIGTTAAATGHAVAMTVRASMSGTKVVWYKCQHVERGLYPFFRESITVMAYGPLPVVSQLKLIYRMYRITSFITIYKWYLGR